MDVGYVGTSQKHSGPAETKPPESVSSLLSDMENDLGILSEFVGEMKDAANHISGTRPEPVGESKGEPAPSNLLSRLSRNNARLRYLLNDAQSELRRIKSAL